MRSIYIQSDKSIFKFDELPAEAYAASMGLPGAPQIKFADNKASKKAVRGGEKKRQEEKEPEVEDMELGASSDEDEDEEHGEDPSHGGESEDHDDEISGDEGDDSDEDPAEALRNIDVGEVKVS
jgi:ATP-dependent RNA helicase DDX10/DBP4